MAEDSEPAAYVINLDRSRERLSAAASQLDEAGIGWQRISAIDGHAFDEVLVARYDVATFARNVGRGISGSEIALHLSHMKAMEAFLESRSTAGLIFEADFVIDDLSTFKRVASALMRCPACWDIVRLSGAHRYSLPVKQACLVAPHVLAAPLLKLTGATCYLINRRAAAIILERLPPINDHFDHRLDQPWLFGLNYRMVHPFPSSRYQHDQLLKSCRQVFGVAAPPLPLLPNWSGPAAACLQRPSRFLFVQPACNSCRRREPMNTINFLAAAAAIEQNNKQRCDVAQLHSANAREPTVEQAAGGLPARATAPDQGNRLAKDSSGRRRLLVR
jgi:GR25 family glycosyltransferase involved in LPS biosynthesis